jgi:hypothetical protein
LLSVTVLPVASAPAEGRHPGAEQRSAQRCQVAFELIMLWRRQIGQYIGEVNLAAASKCVVVVALEYGVREEFC